MFVSGRRYSALSFSPAATIKYDSMRITSTNIVVMDLFRLETMKFKKTETRCRKKYGKNT